MNKTDIKKCIKHGYAWSSCGDKPEKTPTKDYTRGQLKIFDRLYATKADAMLAIAMRREDAPANDHAEVKCDMPETLMLNGKLHKRLAEGEPREIGDVPVDGSQTNRFGSVYYRPIAETLEQRDARIKALVDGYIAKGGPITKEQLTDETQDPEPRMSPFTKPPYITPEWKAWSARRDTKASNKEPVAPVEVIPTNASESAKLSNKPDAVSHPSHYTSHPSGVECITITKHMNFCRGNAVKYLWRAGQKGDSIDKEIEDIAKAEEYCRIEKERLIAKKGAK